MFSLACKCLFDHLLISRRIGDTPRCGAEGVDGAASEDLAVGVDDAPPADPTSAASVPDKASSKLGEGAPDEDLLPVAVANAGAGAADVALLGANGAAAVVGLSSDEPRDVEVCTRVTGGYSRIFCF